MNRFSSLRVLGIGLLLAGATATDTAGVTLAQDDAAVDPASSHLAHIHNGSCAELDPAPLQNLENVEPRMNEDETDGPMGVLTAPRVLYSTTDVDMSLDDMLAESHAINVHKSAEEPEVYIACGDIGGTVVDDVLYVGLAPLNDSGFYGVAKLEKDGDKTKVEIFLVEPSGDSTPAATPAA